MKPVPWRRGLPEASRGVTSTTDRLLSLKILSVLAKAGEPMSRMKRKASRGIFFRGFSEY
jgi:hypothetical protein